MEEKERYELFGEFGIIHDTSPNAECMLLNKFQTCEILNKQDKENQQLKQQLAEKNKEIEKVKKSKTYIMNFGSKVKEVQVVDDNQDKISFAVEQLTQAIKNIKKCNYKDFGIMYQRDAIAVIENQINALRNNKDGIH